MTSQPAHDADISPFWQVQPVFDPDGTGKDFAYTIGLHERGLPELHIWARPSLGEDPGLDWMLSIQDRYAVLNELAGMLVAGRLSIGSQVEREYDDGLAHVTFRVDPPGDREELEAYGVPPGVDVLPVLWSLHRAPEGLPAALTAEAEKRACQRFQEIADGLDTRGSAPLGWAVPATPSFNVEQRFGPLTAVVLARAAQLWQADNKTLTELVDAAAATDAGWSLSSSMALANGVARPAGRRQQLAALEDAVHALVMLLTARPAAKKRWCEVARGFDAGLWDSLDRPGRQNVQHNLARMLFQMTAGCLMVEAVADHASESLVLQARGPWLSGLRGERVLCDPAWRAAPDVLAVVRRLLRPLDAQGLTTLAAIHHLASRSTVPDAQAYPELCARLESWALTSAAACPWQPVLSELPGWRPLLQSLPGAVLGPMAELESWATCFSSALTHRARLTADDVRTFAAPCKVYLPQLEEVLNMPV